MKTIVKKLLILVLALIMLSSCANIIYKPIQKRQNKNQIPVTIAKVSAGHVLTSILLWPWWLSFVFDAFYYKGSLYVEDTELTQKLIQDILLEKNSLSKQQAVAHLDSIFRSSKEIKEGYADSVGLFYINDFITFDVIGTTKTTYFDSKLKVDYSEIERILFKRKGLMEVHTNFDYYFPYLLDFEKNGLDRLIASLLITCPEIKNIIIFNKGYYFPKQSVPQNN